MSLTALASPSSDGQPETIMPTADVTTALTLPPPLMDRLHHALHRYLQSSDVVLLDSVAQFAATQTTSAVQLRDILTVGAILADMRIDATGITAGMLQHLAIDPVSNSIIPDVAEGVNQAFGADVAYLIQNIAHFTSIESQRKNRQFTNQPRRNEDSEQNHRLQLEKIRKMFVSMGDDPRIVIFKLADHLLKVRGTDLPPDEATLWAEESRDIYAPLAARLGMSRVESELEDRAFAQLEPEEFRRVSNLVEQVRKEQRDYIERVCAMLKDEAAKIGIEAEVSGRYKHLWSIYRKLQRNGWDIHQVYDLIAFRIVVPTVPDCYAMLGQVHALWPPREDRIKDFIAHKKANGYQSLHTTVFCLDRRLAEIQIRTAEMHQNAEYGVAMHWYYKDVGDEAQLDKRLGPWIKQIQDWQADLQQRTTAQEFVASGQDGVGTRSQVFVFTPHGDVKDLPQGSTPVDFAYQIHTKLGDHCAGARIIPSGAQMTRRMVPLDYELESGQIVEIITRENAHPTRDWLKFVRTHAARSHINRYLKLHERDIYITVGHDRLELETRKAGLGNLDGIGEEALRLVTDQLHYHSVDELFAEIGGDTLRTSVVVQALQAYLKSIAPLAPPVEAPLPITSTLPTSDAVLNLAGVGGLLARLGNCCHPLPSDPIIGFISRGRGIVIHHVRCRSLKRLREREEERLVQVNWQQMRLDRYEAPLVVYANDRTGLMRDVTQQIQEMKINMLAVGSMTNRKGLATISLTLQLQVLNPRKRDDGTVIPPAEVVMQLVEEAIRRIHAVRDVIAVQRDTRALIPEEGDVLPAAPKAKARKRG
jgi:GTP pyrophosphokinase